MIENDKDFLFRKRERHRNIADTNDDLKKSWRLLLKNTSSPSTGVTGRAPTPEDVMMTIQEGLSGVHLSGGDVEVVAMINKRRTREENKTEKKKPGGFERAASFEEACT